MKKNFSFTSRLWYTLCLLIYCGFLSSLSLSAQQQGWKISLAPPALESPTNVTSNSFTATWSNVSVQQKNSDGTPWNEVFFRSIITREIKAKQDGVYKIANATIKPNPDGTRKQVSYVQTLLNDQLSQPDWSTALLYWTPNGFSINAKDMEGSGLPVDMIGANARLTSPIMDLSNGDRKYTVEFTAKALQANGQSVRMKIFGYGEELNYSGGVPGVKDFTLPNDGKTHKFNFDFEGGTWCNRIVIEINDFAEVEFSGELTVKQQLKKGETSFRSTYYLIIPYQEVKSHSDNPEDIPLGPERYKVKYSYDFTKENNAPAIDSRCLDLNAAKADGERVAYRMLYTDNSPGYGDRRNLNKSMYSAPSYFDNVEEDNNYLYVGYCGYEAPNYEAVEPAGPSWAGYHGGAIKITKELLKDHVGSKVVGIRFASAACLQDNQVNDNPGYFDVTLPCIFLAKTVLTLDRTDINNPVVITPWDPIEVTSVGKFKDGWNSLFFANPYLITEDSEFFAGAYAYDAAAKGGILVRSYHTPGEDPNSAWIATNWGTYTIGEAQFNSKVNKWEGPLLMQIIVEPKTVDPTIQNRGELRGLTVPAFAFTDEELKPTVALFNSGIKDITKIKIETELGGKKQEQTIELDKYVPSSLTQSVELQAINHEGISGKVKLTVKLLEVNGVALKTPSTQTADLELLRRDEVFERTTLVEVFTSEACQYCPAGVKWMEDLINKPENEKIRKNLAVVSHHSFFAPDFMEHPYSKGLAPFYGVRNDNGDITLVRPSSPTNMFNRKPVAALDDARGKNGSVCGIIKNQTELEKVVDDAKRNPASVRLEVKPWFKKDDNKLNVIVEGHASARLDRSRPVYLTIMVTQDQIAPRDQKYSASPIPGFVHTNVLRYVDDAGFKGTEVKFEENGDFKIVKEFPINSTNATTGKLAENAILLEGSNNTLEDAMKQTNVIAFLHYYQELPTNDNVENNDMRLLGNEVLNAAQRGVSFSSFDAVDMIANQNVHVTVQDGSIEVNVPYTDLKVYDMAGHMISATGIQEGVYLVRLELTDGSVIFTKVIAK